MSAGRPAGPDPGPCTRSRPGARMRRRACRASCRKNYSGRRPVTSATPRRSEPLLVARRVREESHARPHELLRKTDRKRSAELEANGAFAGRLDLFQRCGVGALELPAHRVSGDVMLPCRVVDEDTAVE